MIAQTLEKCVARDTFVKELNPPGVWRYTPNVTAGDDAPKKSPDPNCFNKVDSDQPEKLDYNEYREDKDNPFLGFFWASIISIPIWALILWLIL